MSAITLQDRLHALLDRLDKLKSTAADRWIARCPAHDDRGPSLSVRLVDDRILIHCFAGCDAIDVVNAVGLELADLFEDSRTTSSVKHSYKPTHRRIPATDALAAIDHEAHVVAIIAADMQGQKDIDNDTWNRLATAVSRIGNARALR